MTLPKYQSPEFKAKVGIHSPDSDERRRAYANGEDKTGTLGVVVIKSKGKIKRYIDGKRVP